MKEEESTNQLRELKEKLSESVNEVQEKDKRTVLLTKKSQQLTESIDALVKNEKKLETDLTDAAHTVDGLKEKVHHLTTLDKNHKKLEEEQMSEIASLRSELEQIRLSNKEKDQDLERVKADSQRLATVGNTITTLREEKAILLDRCRLGLPMSH